MRSSSHADQFGRPDRSCLPELGIDNEAALTAAILAQAADASHADDLVQSASHGLFSRRILTPGARCLQDWARDAFASVEAQILCAVDAAVPPAAAQKVIDAAYSPRPGSDTPHLEWLKTPSKRHGPSTLAETIDKVCFLRVTLLELTDVALLQTSRRSQQLFREAADKVQSNRVRGTTSLIQQAAKARSVLHDESKTCRRESSKPENCSPNSAMRPAAASCPKAGVAIEGIEQHYNAAADKMGISLLAVDTHGDTNPAMAIAKLLGFDLCPRLRDLAERKLYLPRGFAVPDGLEVVTVRRLSLAAIERGWDELLRLAASIRSARVSATLALQRFGSAAQGDPLHRAAEHLGRLLRTVFLCDYIAIEDFRREIHPLLDRGESAHQLQRAVYSGQVVPERGRRRDKVWAISGSHVLLTKMEGGVARLHFESTSQLQRAFQHEFRLASGPFRRGGAYTGVPLPAAASQPLRMTDPQPTDTTATPYTPPAVWTWKPASGGRFASINRPIAGATHEQELPVGRHPLQLYSLGTPNGVKVTVMLEELLALGHAGAEYDAWLINISEGAQFGSGFVAVNPNSKIPALLDRSGPKPVRVFESGAILLYLAEKFGALLPTEPAARAECLSWLFWQMGSAPYLGGGFGHFYAYAPSKIEYAIDRYAMETKRQLDVLDRRLAESAYLAGDEYTIADIAVWPWYGALAKGQLYGAGEFLQVQDYTHVLRWTNAIAQRPAARRGRRVNRTWGEPGSQLRERHEASDFDTPAPDGEAG